MSRFVTALLNIFRRLPNSSRRPSVIPVSLVLLGCAGCAQVSTGHMFDETAAPGANYAACRHQRVPMHPDDVV